MELDAPGAEATELPGPRSVDVPEIAWGQRECDACRRKIRSPSHAAQALDESGEWLAFDDPGCLVIELATRRLRPLYVALHHADEERWMNLGDAGFVRREGTPMAYGFAAVDSAAGALSLDEVGSALAARYQLAWPPGDGVPAARGSVFNGVTQGAPVLALLVEAACGRCQFGLGGETCGLAVRVGPDAWFVDGAALDSPGAPGAPGDLCKAVRPARVTGRVVDGRFRASALALVDEGGD